MRYALQVKLYLVRYILQDCQPPVGPYARIKLRFKTFKIKYFGAFGSKYYQNEERNKTNPHWYTAEKEKTNYTKVINNTISLGFQRQRP